MLFPNHKSWASGSFLWISKCVAAAMNPNVINKILAYSTIKLFSNGKPNFVNAARNLIKNSPDNIILNSRVVQLLWVTVTVTSVLWVTSVSIFIAYFNFQVPNLITLHLHLNIESFYFNTQTDLSNMFAILLQCLVKNPKKFPLQLQ